jgi:predicted nucleotidyltransferase
MQVHLLSLLLLQSERSWTLDELSEHLRAPSSSVHRELHRLLDAGLVSRDVRQRPHAFRAASNAPAYAPLRELIELTAGVPQRLADELEHVGGIVAAAIHGSWAAGKIRPDSDLDVIVVTDGDRRAAQQAVRRVGRSIGREVDASVLTRASLEDLRRARNPFLGRILHGPRIDVVGDLSGVIDPA